ncbi:MAG TPA: molybdopterin-dependent oxidoreductase, partial [bacterium]|nr:molybdopterin-dependent oxidoreductase [bacterium]
GVYGIAAAKLAKIAGAPVRLMLDRKEEHIAAGNRPSAVQKLRVGANARGEIQAIKLIAHGTAGVGTGAGCDGPAMNLYFAVPHKYSEQYDVFTHAGAGAAFRAPGHPQGTFALEQSVDELAYKLNMDPLALRRINSKTDSVRLAEYDIGAKRFGWDRRAAQPAGDKGPIKRGFGMANAVWYYIYGTGFQATIEVHSDGSVDLTNGVQDIGGGIRTALAMIVAEELGLQTKDIVIKIGDTQYGLGPASGGSQTTAGITPAARHAAYLAKLKMFEIAAPMLGVPSDDLSVADGRIFSRRDTSKVSHGNKLPLKSAVINFRLSENVRAITLHSARRT